MATFMEIKCFNPKMRQSQTAEEIGFSGSTLQRYRQGIFRLLPYTVQTNTHKRRQNTAIDDIRRPQLTSKDLE